MTDKEGQYWADYIGELAELMGLKDWHLELNNRAPNGDTAIGEIECVYGRKYGIVRLKEGWGQRKPEDQRQTIAHELIHCHLEPLVQHVENDLKGTLGKEAYDMLVWSQRRTLEYAVNDIARAWAASLPLPKPPKDKA